MAVLNVNRKNTVFEYP